MDKMESMKMSQKEYLRKYLSDKDDGVAKRKKKKKTKVGPKTVKIIDDDIDIRNMRPMEEGEFKIFNTTEDAPQIVGVIDERGPVDFADTRRWRIIADDGEGNVACDSNENYGSLDGASRIDLEARKNTKENVKRSKRKDPSPAKNTSSDSENEKSKRDVKRSGQHRGSTKKKQRRESSSDSSSSNSSESSDRKKSKSKKASSRRRHDSSPARKSSESDQSPPRRRKNKRTLDKEEYSEKEKHRGKSDSDQSPPRRRKNHDRTVDKEEYRGKEKNRGNSDSDQSPPRRRKNHDRNVDKEEYKGKGKNRGNSDSDQSPPRRRKNLDRAVDKEEYSGKGKTRGNFDSDLSPPRRSKNEVSTKNRKRKSKGSDSDLTPPRAPKNTRFESRSNRDDERNDSRNDAQRHRRDERSPKRSRSRWNDDDSRTSRSMESRRKNSGAGAEPKMKKTLDGKTAGLQDARALKIETEAHKKREAAMFKGMSAEVSGVGQAAVFRDRKTGRRRDFTAEAAETREKEKRQAEIDEKYAKWGRGLKQVDDQAEKCERDMYEMSKPLARYANDADLDKALREVEREGDTMLEEIKKRRIKEGKSEPARAVYQGSYAPNRFGIRPGHRWDGVDRSNGYEKKWFEARNARTALQEEAYKWSTADM